MYKRQQHKAARCISEKYAKLPDDYKTKDLFSFVITEPQSCGFVGLETRTFTGENND